MRHHHTPRAPLATIITTLVLTTFAICPAIAEAGSYTVYSCRTPSGAAVGMEGWRGASSVPVIGKDNGSVAACASNGAPASLQFGAAALPVAPGSWLRWTFAAPSATSIASIHVLRAFHLGWPFNPGVAERLYLYQAWEGPDENTDVLDFELPGARGGTLTLDTPAPLDATGKTWDSVSFSLRCWGLTGLYDCGSFPARVTIPQATFGLVDSIDPSGSALSGGLTGDEGPVRGVARLSFAASDAGGGVYRSVLKVDGVDVDRRVVDADGGRCQDVEAANADAYEFGTPQPCPLDVAGAVTFDTRTLRDGQHTVQLRVEDAAGNEAVVHDGSITTHNAPVVSALPAIGGNARVGGALSVDAGQWDGLPTTYDHRWLRCDADGGSCTPIAGAGVAHYVPVAADAYRRLVAEVIAENPSGATTVRTAASPTIADASGHTSPVDETRTPASGDDQHGGAGGRPDARVDTQGVGGLANPVADEGGHAPNGGNAAANPQITLGVRLADGRTARRVRSRRPRTWTLVGRLADDHDRPIGSAHMTLATRVDGRDWVARGAVLTDADGRFTATLPPGPNRTVRLTYFPFADSRTFRSSNTVEIEVTSPVTITADRHRLTGKAIVKLSGRAAGRPMPARGVLVTLQGFQRGWGWRTFRTVRTSHSGSWSTRYRFRSSSGQFAFRAIVPQQGGYPFVTSRSRPVTVTLS